MSLKDNLKNLIQEHHLKPNKLMGQNFLIDRAVLKKIVTAADLSKDDVVLEVGPGLGILTEVLAEHAGQVVAVEKDKKMAEIVKNILKDRNIKNVEIIQGDILKMLPLIVIPAPAFAGVNLSPQKRGAGIQDSGFPRIKYGAGLVKPGMTTEPVARYKVVANIPYYLTSHLIRKFLESANQPSQMVLMIQKEVAQRICASPSQVLPSKTWEGKPPKMSLLAVSVQFYAEPKIISYVSRKSFWPQPKVDSAIIRIIPHNIFYCHSRPCFRRGKLVPAKAGSGNPDNTGSRIKCGMTEEKKESFFHVVRAGFAHPRKQLINNLSVGLKIDRAKIAEALKKIGLKPEQRAETLSVNDWIKLSERLQF